MSKNEETSVCKKCKEEIKKGAKKCPKCGASQGMPVWVIVLIVFLFLGIIGAANSGNDDESGSSASSGVKENNKEKKEEKKIEYIDIDIDVLEDALKKNAASAKDQYNGNYYAITGRLGTIDSDLKYISLLSTTDKYDIIGIHCNIKNNKTKDIVKTLEKDQIIIVKGKITDVGEVLGYFLDIDSIEAK